LIVLGPVLVMVEPARTAKLEVSPRFTVGWLAIAVADIAKRNTTTAATSNGMPRIFLTVFMS
jgi:hypothetical protein